MLAHTLFFYLFSTIAVSAAIMVIISKNSVYSVFFLILVFVNISILFIMIGAEFLGMIMLIVYVGAVAVLFLFVVMMLNVAQQKNQWFSARDSSKHIPIGIIISILIFFELIHHITKLRLVDLPGYGYAKAPKKDIQSWTSLTVKYLKGRPSLRTVCLLIDSRRGVGDYDELIMKELDSAAVSWVVILTKADKLTSEEIINMKEVTNKIISKHPAAFPEIIVTSSLKNDGIPLLRTYLASLS